MSIIIFGKWSSMLGTLKQVNQTFSQTSLRLLLKKYTKEPKCTTHHLNFGETVSMEECCDVKAK